MSDTHQACDLSLILACYNEALILENSVQEIVEILDHTVFTYEIIFVDDCSVDETRALIKKTAARYPHVPIRHLFHTRNVGRGGTVADGFRLARGKIMGYIDIDLEVHARYIPSCVVAIQNGADIATAMRVYKFHLPSLDRYFASKGYKWLMQKLLKVDLQDTETGYKFFNRDKFLPILDEVQDKGWFWDTESMVRAHLRDLKIVEIPCLFMRRFDKPYTVKVLSDTRDYFLALWRFRRTVKAIRRGYD